MVDLETTGTKAGCGVLAIGACSLDGTHTFYEKIDHLSCLSAGLVDDPSTLKWWSKQEILAREEAFSGTKNLVMVLGQFADFLRSLPSPKKTIFVWGNGADFDLPILAAAYQAVGMEVPWEPFNGRCYRTLKNLYKSIPMRKFEGLKHSALADARNQAMHAHEILRIHFDKSQD
jgi:hypothetical protein